MRKLIAATFALCVAAGALNAQPPVVGTPRLDTTNTWSQPQVFNGGVNNFGLNQYSYSTGNSTPSATLGLRLSGINSGPAVGTGLNLGCATVATGAGFDACYEFVYNPQIFQTAANNTTYYLGFQWAFTPSDTTHTWGAGLGENDLSVRLATTPGWQVDRSVGPQNVGGWLEVPIATSNPPATLPSPFTTTLSSGTVAVVHASHMLQTGQWVNFAGATAVGGLTLSGEYQVTVVDANDYTVSAGSNATSSATGGGTVTASEFNGTDQRYAYSVSRSSDVNFGTGRYARSYIGYNCEPNAVVGVTIDPNSHGGDCFAASGAGFVLVSNPITTNGTSTVSIAWPNSGLATSGTNSTFVLSGAASVGGYSANGTHTVVSVNTTTVTYTDAGASGSNTVGGGSAVLAYGTADVPEAAYTVPQGAFTYGLRLDQGSYTGSAIRLGTGQTIAAAGGASVGIAGNTTSGSSCTGCVGEYLTNVTQAGANATVTITIAAPGVITWTGHGLSCLSSVYLSNAGGALPTGFSAFTNYYVSCGSVTANTFQLSTTMANALAGTSITTSGTQSGTQSGHAQDILNNGSAAASDVVGVPLAAGDYDCTGVVIPGYGSGTSLTSMAVWLSAAGGSTLPYSQATNATILAGLAAGLNSFSTAAIVTPNISMSPMPVRIKLTAPGMAVLSMQSTFTVSSMDAAGAIRCRRVE